MRNCAVVPFLVLIPALGAGARELAVALTWAGLKAVLLLALLLVFGQSVMRWLFNLVAARKSSELFVLAVLLVTLGLASATELAGLSLALGAFVAGILISETEYRYQVEDYIKPFRDVLLGLFFVTIGMMLDLRVVMESPVAVVVALVTLLMVKFAIIFGLARAFGNDQAVGLRAALALSPAGEFGFVLLSQTVRIDLMPTPVAQIALAAMLISMLLSPILLKYSDRIVLYFSPDEWMQRAIAIHDLSVKTLATQGHVIICGYGRSGQALARFLETENITVMALDLDPDRVRQAGAAGDSVVFGDAGRREVLMAAGIARASALVISFSEVDAALRILSHTRELRPDLPVVVRTVDEGDMDRLKAAGAAEIVPEVVEGSLMLATHAMLLVGIPLGRVLRHVREVRTERYRLMRAFFHGRSDIEESIEDEHAPRLTSILLESGAAALGKRLGELRLEAIKVEVSAIRRRHQRDLKPGSDVVFEPGDVVVLLGRPEDLAAAEIRLLQG